MDDSRRAEIRALGKKIKTAKKEELRLSAVIHSPQTSPRDRVQALLDYARLVEDLKRAVAFADGDSLPMLS